MRYNNFYTLKYYTMSVRLQSPTILDKNIPLHKNATVVLIKNNPLSLLLSIHNQLLDLFIAADLDVILYLVVLIRRSPPSLYHQLTFLNIYNEIRQYATDVQTFFLLYLKDSSLLT